MPIYEYECRGCEQQFEEWQKINDPPVKKCPSCGSRRVQRLISASSFHLKGGGWYADAYSSTKGGGSSSKTTKSTSSKGGDKASSGSGDKPSGTQAAASAG